MFKYNKRQKQQTKIWGENETIAFKIKKLKKDEVEKRKITKISSSG